MGSEEVNLVAIGEQPDLLLPRIGNVLAKLAEGLFIAGHSFLVDVLRGVLSQGFNLGPSELGGRGDCPQRIGVDGLAVFLSEKVVEVAQREDAKDGRGRGRDRHDGEAGMAVGQGDQGVMAGRGRNGYASGAEEVDEDGVAQSTSAG